MADGFDNLGPILVPVDFSSTSRAALVWGARLASRLGLAFEVLHVVHDPESEPGSYRPVDSDVRSFESAASEMLATFIERTVERYPDLSALSEAPQILVSGLPANRILEIAAAQKSQLIVMGSQGRTGLSKLWLGSKAQRVVQLSPIPVTIVKAVEVPGEETE